MEKTIRDSGCNLCSGENPKEHVAELLNFQLAGIAENLLYSLNLLVQRPKTDTRKLVALEFRPIV